MMILVTGGSRSGKSSFAIDLARKREGPHAYVATAVPSDDEMKGRIEAHRRARPTDWLLVEEPRLAPRALAQALRAARTVVLDCVTIWMSNLLIANGAFDEARAGEEAASLVTAIGEAPPGSTVIVVTNEVGSGVVPQTELGRQFRDCAGRANQVLARAADEVYLMVSGIPVPIKEGRRHGT